MSFLNQVTLTGQNNEQPISPIPLVQYQESTKTPEDNQSNCLDCDHWFNKQMMFFFHCYPPQDWGVLPLPHPRICFWKTKHYFQPLKYRWITLNCVYQDKLPNSFSNHIFVCFQIISRNLKMLFKSNCCLNRTVVLSVCLQSKIHILHKLENSL